MPLVERYGERHQIPQVEVNCDGDTFENQIRDIGVVFACEWFGYSSDSDFTAETIRVLCERSGVDPDK